MQGRRVMMFNRNEKDLDIFAHFFFSLGVDVYPMEKAKKKIIWISFWAPFSVKLIGWGVRTAQWLPPNPPPPPNHFTWIYACAGEVAVNCGAKYLH